MGLVHYNFSSFGTPEMDLGELKQAKLSTNLSLPWFKLHEVFLSLAHSPQLFRNDPADHGRSSEYGLGIPSLLFLDIDEVSTLADAMYAFKNYQHIIYTSKSHQKQKVTSTGKHRPACDRFRVVLALSKPINDKTIWKNTIKALEISTGIVCDPALHYWGFFFPGTSIVSNSPTGKLVEPNESDSLELDEAGAPPWDEYYLDGKGILTIRTRNFLRDGAPPGHFNHELFCAAADAKDQNYTEEEFRKFYFKASPKKHTGPAHLDQTDEATIVSAFSRDVNSSSIRLIKKKKKPGGRPCVEYTQSSIDQAVNALAQRLIIDKRPEDTFIYEIVDLEKKEVQFVQNEDLLDTIFEEERIKEENFLETLINRKPSGVKAPGSLFRWREIFRLKSRNVEQEVAPFLLPHEDGYTLKKLTFAFEKGSYPAWEEFLVRLSDRQAFMEWVGSCFDKANKGRQALWLYGSEGEDGKSKVLVTLSNVFGEAASAIDANRLKSDPRFLSSGLYKKRFVTYCDCKMPSFVRSEFFRNVTSEDNVSIEFKGKNSFTASLHIKLAIASNKRPAPEGKGKSDISRLLIIEVKPSKVDDDALWPIALEKELGYFLYDCINLYEVNVKQKGLAKIPISDLSKELIDESAEIIEEVFEAIFEHLELDWNAPFEKCIKSSEMIRTYYDVAGHYGKKYKDFDKFREYLEIKKKIKYKTIGEEPNKKRVYWPIVRFRETFDKLKEFQEM